MVTTLQCILWISLLTPVISLQTQQVQSEWKGNEPVTIVFNEDVHLPKDKSYALVVLVNGKAVVEGSVKTLMILEGSATLDGAAIGELITVSGDVSAMGDSHISGDVRLINATFEQASTVILDGTVLEGNESAPGPGAAIFGTLFGIGFMLAILVAAALWVAITPQSVQQMGSFTQEAPIKAIGLGVLAWLGIPFLATMAFITVVGVPIGIGLLVFLLPLLIIAGYLLTGIHIGNTMLERVWGSMPSDRPVQSAIFGLSVLLLLGWVPTLGPLLTVLASMAGSGALIRSAWKRMRANVERSPEWSPALS